MVADFGYDRAGNYLSDLGRGWLAGLDLLPISREIVTDCLAVTGRPRPANRPNRAPGSGNTPRSTRWLGR